MYLQVPADAKYNVVDIAWSYGKDIKLTKEEMDKIGVDISAVGKTDTVTEGTSTLTFPKFEARHAVSKT